MAFLVLWLLFCNAGGVGGGSTLVPLLKILYHFTNVSSIGLTNCVTAVSGLVRYIYDAPKRHPLKRDLQG
jgi:uncharacterized membrane protein YfcA